MLTKQLSELKAQQAEQIFAILDSLRPGQTITFSAGENGRKHIRVTEYDRETDDTTERVVVSGASARDVFAQACVVLA